MLTDVDPRAPVSQCDLAHNWWWGGGKKCGVPNACVPHNEPSNPPSPPGDDCCPDGWKYKRMSVFPSPRLALFSRSSFGD